MQSLDKKEHCKRDRLALDMAVYNYIIFVSCLILGIYIVMWFKNCTPVETYTYVFVCTFIL